MPKVAQALLSLLIVLVFRQRPLAIFRMEVSCVNSDSDKEYDIQQKAELCHAGFVNIIAAVQRDKTVIERIPSLFVQTPGEKPILTAFDLRDEFDQFRIWAENIGVFASDHESLDYRLREASDVKEGIVSLLQSLRTDLEEGIAPRLSCTAALLILEF